MEIFGIISVLTILAAGFGFINAKYIKLPFTIGMMLIATIFSFGVFSISFFDAELEQDIVHLIEEIDFKTLLLDVMLSFLLFAGALHTNFEKLKKYKWPILTFATFGVLVSTFLIGGLVYLILNVFNFEISFIYCLLFGALISPTDPIAVLGIMKKVGVPKSLEIKIVGESLFNDGIGVVIFITIFNLASAGHGDGHDQSIFMLFVQEVLGGIVLGLSAGWGTWQLMKSIDDWAVEVMITLATVMGVYWIAHTLHLSGPLAVVVAGLMIGTENVRNSSMSEETESYIDKFWELIDTYLNAILFVLIGLEILILPTEGRFILMGFLIVPIVLISRFISLYPPVAWFGRTLDFAPKTALIMTWGGLRGGISIALALSLTEAMNKDLFLVITYIVVVFSILVQGLTIGKLVKSVQ